MPIALSMTYTAFLLVSVAIMRAGLPRFYFAAIPGCWPGRTLPTTGCPQPGRPRSGCALGPFVPHAAHAPMEVSRTASRRLRSVFAYAPTAARWRGLPPAACSARPTPPSGLMQGLRGRVVCVRHARPAAHTLRVVVRAAALFGLSAYVQSISQRGRQSHPAGVTPTVTASHKRPNPRFRIRHAAAPREVAAEP